MRTHPEPVGRSGTERDEAGGARGDVGGGVEGGAQPDDALRAGERVLSGTAGAAKVLAVVMLLAGVAGTPLDAPRFWPLVALAVVLTAESAGFAWWCWTRGVAPAWLGCVDTVVVAASLWPAGLLLRAADGAASVHAGSPTYNFMMFAAVSAGLVRWPPAAALTAAALCGASALGNALLVTVPPMPRWNAVPDAISPVSATVLVLVIAHLLRRAARLTDRLDEEAVRRTARLAAGRERVRHGGALRAGTLDTLDGLLARDAVPEGLLRRRLAAEVEWLHRVIDGAPENQDETAGLHARLRSVAAEQRLRGLDVAVETAGEEPPLPPDRLDALTGAVREALTNVAKHAGVRAARVAAAAEGRRVRVTVSDDGAGFDPALTPPGFGTTHSMRGRLAEVGGDVEVHARPGAGTHVVLWADL